MELEQYMNWTRETAVYPEAGSGSQREMNYLVIGLNDEAGEVAGKWKKLLRAGVVSLSEDLPVLLLPEHRNMILDEMGDVLWYLARMCKVLGITPEDLADRNVGKLTVRKAEGQLGSITR